MKSLPISTNFFSKTIRSTSLALSIFVAPFTIAENLTETQQTQLNEISALLKQNPEVIEGLHENLTQYIDGQSSIETTLKDNHDFLYNNPMHPSVGSETPKLTIINFTDYNCPYCKRLESGLVAMVDKYPELRVINIYLPFQQRMIPGLDTNTAWYALNVWENDRTNFAEVHRLMMAKPSRHDSKSIFKIAEMTGTKDELSATPSKKILVDKNEQVFRDLGLRGTPSLIIGDEIIPGFIPEQQLEKLIKSQLESD